MFPERIRTKYCFDFSDPCWTLFWVSGCFENRLWVALESLRTSLGGPGQNLKKNIFFYFWSSGPSPIRSPNQPPRPPSTDSQQKTVQYACAERSPRPLSVDNEALYDFYRTSKRWTTGTVEAPTSLWDPFYGWPGKNCTICVRC